MQAAGSLRGTITKPAMLLPFLVRVARATQTETGGLSPSKTWAYLPGYYKCDAQPIRDELYFMQSGAENMATAIMFFEYNTDIQDGDRVVMLPPDNIVGMAGSWYEIKERTMPMDSLGFIQCYVFVADKPPGVS